MPSSNPLPPKENTLFKRILKCYEQKQYKNGLKFAKQILSNPKFAEHGETLAMKGLTLNCLGRKEEAFEHVRRGLRNDLKSHVCWHVYGLLQRSDKKYDEAIKCYRNALKWDKDNIQILRDLSLLQIQMRDLEGYRDTRYQLFMLRPTQRASWIGYAMSYHLLDDYDTALKILEEFRKTQVKAAHDYELSELLLYQNMVLRESGDLSEAERHLREFEEDICDKRQVLEIKGGLHLKQRNLDAAVSVYKELLDRNPHNRSYYLGLASALGLDTDDRVEDRLAFYREHQLRYPRSIPPRRLPLDFVEGDAFIALIEDYIRPALRKGIPPLFTDLRPLFMRKPHLTNVVGNLVTNYVTSLKDFGCFTPHDKELGLEEPASAVLWCYYYLAQHWDFLGDSTRALTYIDLAMEHTPTLIELHIVKAKIYKHAGDLVNAWRCMDEAQSLDTADRYLNSKCAKYMLRANMIKPVEELCGKFTREGVPAMDSLNEMQCMWFQTECALAYKRLGNYGESLKKCHEVGRHFQEILEDQFDFHTYCLRKMTLCSYVGLLRLEDVLQSHPFYFKAARCAIKVYLKLHDHPVPSDINSDVINTENLSPAELKKLRNKQKKAKKKAAQAAEEAAAAERKKEMHRRAQNQSSGGGNEAESDTPKSDALDAERLLRCDQPLSEAEIFLKPLQSLCPKIMETHILAFEIYFRRGKTLLMLQALKRAWSLDPSHASLHPCLIRFLRKMQLMEGTSDLGEGNKFKAMEGDSSAENAERAFPAAVKKVIHEQLAQMLETEDEALWEARKINEEFLNRHSDCLEHAFEGARMLYYLDPSSLSRCLELISDPTKTTKGASLDVCSRILTALEEKEFGDTDEVKQLISLFKERCRSIFPLATIFADPPGSPQGNHLSPSENGAPYEDLTVSA